MTEGVRGGWAGARLASSRVVGMKVWDGVPCGEGARACAIVPSLEARAWRGGGAQGRCANGQGRAVVRACDRECPVVARRARVCVLDTHASGAASVRARCTVGERERILADCNARCAMCAWANG